MKSRVLYEIDPFNRLIVGQGGKKTRVKRFREVVSGAFKIDEKNNLFYEINKSQGIDTPQKIKFSGNYSIDKNHNLIFTLNKWNNQCEGNRLILKARIIDAKSDEITFLMNSRVSPTKGLTYIVRLYGSWQVDNNNRLTFGVQRDKDEVDKLTLFSSWDINKNNEVTYSCGEGSGVIGLRGQWALKDKYRLSYTLDKRINSGFDFTTSFGQVVPKGKGAYVIFDIGITISKEKTIHRKITFSGKWKMGKGSEIILETSPLGNEKAASLKFTKEIFGQDGLAYIESSLRDKEKFIGAGMIFRW